MSLTSSPHFILHQLANVSRLQIVYENMVHHHFGVSFGWLREFASDRMSDFQDWIKCRVGLNPIPPATTSRALC
jgi:hypothetical protein